MGPPAHWPCHRGALVTPDALTLAAVLVATLGIVIVLLALVADSVGRWWADRRRPWGRFREAQSLGYFDYLDVVDEARNDETPDLSRGRGPVSVEAPGTALPLHTTPGVRDRQDVIGL